jgi:SAM-dependent methyltransferase
VLCGSPAPAPFHRDRKREYLRCGQCALVFVPGEYHLEPAAERAEYQLHQNSPDDDGYRAFLSRLQAPLCQRLPAHSSGLDFGCGPGPTLSVMLEEQGHRVALYDPFFFPDTSCLQSEYDFVTATEVVEHLGRPGDVLQQLWRCLRGGGYLGVMTKLVTGREAFRAWHYKNDATHVSFFSEQTWQWWAARQSAGLEIIGADVILLRKSA